MLLDQSIDCFLLRHTQFDWTAACWSNRGLTGFVFGRKTPQAAIESIETANRKRSVVAQVPGDEEESQFDYLLEVLEQGIDDMLLDVKLDLTGYTDFQKKVVRAVRRIPRGQTASYGQVAAKVGSPRAARAFGTVMAQNRYPLIVPCHRVVAASSLGGFSAPDGISLKRRLLKLEGAK